MTEYFGKRWTEQHGDKPAEMWRRAIETLTDEQIKSGFARMLNESVKHPPGLPEFMDFCQNKKQEEHSRTHPEAYIERLPRLPETDEQFQARLAAGNEKLRNLKSLLRIKT